MASEGSQPDPEVPKGRGGGGWSSQQPARSFSSALGHIASSIRVSSKALKERGGGIPIGCGFPLDAGWTSKSL